MGNYTEIDKKMNIAKGVLFHHIKTFHIYRNMQGQVKSTHDDFFDDLDLQNMINQQYDKLTGMIDMVNIIFETNWTQEQLENEMLANKQLPSVLD